MAAKLAAVLCGASEDTVNRLGSFAEAVGIAFQIQDDILDLSSIKFADRKGGRGQDITEGKKSLIVIYTLKKASQKDRRRLLEILQMHTTEQRLRNEAIRIMKKYDALAYAKTVAQKLVSDNWKQIDRLLQPSEAKEKLRAFADYLVERKI
jgi:geranylgeranyl pyrophosphate synthase